MFAEVNKQTVVTFPYDYDTLCKKNPHTKFSQDGLMQMYAGTEANLSGNELVKVVQEEHPQIDAKTQMAIQQDKPSLVNGVWTLGWLVKTLSLEEQKIKQQNKANLVRSERNQKLVESDWTQLLDANVNKTAWAAYRQALRDVPTQTGFPWNVTWPTQP